LPDAVPVATTTWVPSAASDAAVAWCSQGWAMPCAVRAATTLGPAQPGHGAVRPTRAGICSTWVMGESAAGVRARSRWSSSAALYAVDVTSCTLTPE